MAKTGVTAHKIAVKRARSSARSKTSDTFKTSPVGSLIRALSGALVMATVSGLCGAYAIYEIWKLEELLSASRWGKVGGGMWPIISLDPSHTWLRISGALLFTIFCSWFMWNNLRAAWRALEQI